MPIGLRHVISGILAGGIPGFRMVLLLLHLWKFATLWEHPLGKGEATCHSSPWYMVLCTEDVWKATTRVPCSHMTRMVENTLLVAEGICTTIFY